ncbi:MAG: hypothetical protein II919_04425 [Lachnospiraceae bacterium]|nr:hypothetical protein [Lachnospiraceae bacterium]
MNAFSKYLSEYVGKKSISYRKAAMAINMDRSQFRRYVIGERLPKNEIIVSMIANGIGMSKDESERLLKYYHRSKMGEIKYNWYKTFIRLLNGNLERFANCKKEDRSDLDFRLAGDIGGNSHISNISSKDQLTEYIKNICYNARYVNIVLRTRNYEFYEMMFQSIKTENECNIRQIVQLNNISFQEDQSDVQIFENIYKMFQCGKECRVFYAYNDLAENIYSNFVVSDKGLIVFNLFDDNVSNIVGVYANDSEIIAYYNSKFNNMKSKCYVYGYSCNVLAKEYYQTDRMIENKESGIKAGVYQLNDTQGMWIRNFFSCRNKYVCIEENDIVNHFKMYVNENHYEQVEGACDWY